MVSLTGSIPAFPYPRPEPAPAGPAGLTRATSAEQDFRDVLSGVLLAAGRQGAASQGSGEQGDVAHRDPRALDADGAAHAGAGRDGEGEGHHVEESNVLLSRDTANPDRDDFPEPAVQGGDVDDVASGQPVTASPEESPARQIAKPDDPVAQSARAQGDSGDGEGPLEPDRVPGGQPRRPAPGAAEADPVAALREEPVNAGQVDGAARGPETNPAQPAGETRVARREADPKWQAVPGVSERFGRTVAGEAPVSRIDREVVASPRSPGAEVWPTEGRGLVAPVVRERATDSFGLAPGSIREGVAVRARAPERSAMKDVPTADVGIRQETTGRWGGPVPDVPMPEPLLKNGRAEPGVRSRQAAAAMPHVESTRPTATVWVGDRPVTNRGRLAGIGPLGGAPRDIRDRSGQAPAEAVLGGAGRRDDVVSTDHVPLDRRGGGEKGGAGAAGQGLKQAGLQPHSLALPERDAVNLVHRAEGQLRHDPNPDGARTGVNSTPRPDGSLPLVGSGDGGRVGSLDAIDGPAVRRSVADAALATGPAGLEPKAMPGMAGPGWHAPGRVAVQADGRAMPDPSVGAPVDRERWAQDTDMHRFMTLRQDRNVPGAEASALPTGGQPHQHARMYGNTGIATGQAAMPGLADVQTADQPVDPIAPVHGEVHTATRPGTGAPAGPTTLAAAQAAPPQVLQVSAAIRSSSDAIFDIHLSPAELGKVRISLTPSDNGILVNVLADRPETLDLLRRHADQLEQDFRELGYENTAFSFGAGGQDEAGAGGHLRQPDRSEPEGGVEAVDRDAGTPRPDAQPAATGRVDLRL